VNQLIADVVDTGGKHQVAKISTNFHKFEMALVGYPGAMGEICSVTKPEVDNLVSESL
jgi:hypothetical protein